MSSQPKPYLTPEEYLAIERRSSAKHEYWPGVTYPVGGARRAHNVIALNLYGAAKDHFRGKDCEAYPSDMRVRTTPGVYTYRT